MNLILFSVTTFAVLDYFYRFMRFVSTDLAKIAKFLCFYSKSGLSAVSFAAGLRETISTLYVGQALACSPTRYKIVCGNRHQSNFGSDLFNL